MKSHMPPKSENNEFECQCEIGREKLLTAPPYRLVTSMAYTIEARFRSAPCEREAIVVDHKCPMSHYLVTFRSPQLPVEYFQDAYSSYATVKNIKYKMSTLLCLSDTNLVMAIDRVVLKDPTLVSELPTVKPGVINIDVFTKDGQHFSLSSIPKEVYAYDLLTAVVPYKKILPYIIVKFRIIANNRSRGTFSQSFLCTRTIGEIKKKLSRVFEEEPDNLILMRTEAILPDKMALLHLDYDEFGIVELLIMTKNNVVKFNKMLKTDKLCEELPLNDLITVCVPCGESVKHLRVEIVDDRYKKPYLGGYRNTQTGLVYHHAFTQTPQKKENLPPDMKNCRDTQTAEEIERINDTPYSRATQMANERVFIPNVTDRIKSPKPYETYEEMVKRLNHVHYATVIQRAFRHYQFRQQVFKWLAVCRERIARMKEEDRIEREGMERRLRRDLITKTFPRTREDFDQLYAMLDKWKRSEIQRISSLHSKGPKIAEFNLLLDKEIELLRSIESYRIKIREDSRKLKNKEFLEEISKPVVWYGRSGKVVQMDTIEIQKARKFKDLYELFCKEHMEIKERLELLAETRLAMEEFFHPLTEEIIYLLDQEADLIIRNYNDKQLEFLKKRTAAALLQFIKTSELNSGVTKCKDIRDYRKMEDHNLFLCEKCTKVKLYSDFPVHSKVTGFFVCKSCSWKNVRERLWIDMTPYKFILRAVQRDERRRKCWGSLAFVLQDRDVFFLVEKLWHCHSAISECIDVTELRLCRWDVKQDWSPWNCFLVTVQEMKSHIMLENPEEVYDEELVRKIKNKHQLAKQHFEQLRLMNKDYTETGEWHGVRAPAVARVDGVTPI